MERKKQIIKILSGNESISKKADLILILFSEHDFNNLNTEIFIEYIISNDLMPISCVADIRKKAEAFYNYYSSVNWTVGKSKKPMTSWKKALNSWCKRNFEKTKEPKVSESIKAMMMIKESNNQIN